MAFVSRLLRMLPLILISPVLLGVSAGALAFADLAWLLFGRRRATCNTRPANRAASVVIPNWNGRDLLEKYLPSVLEAVAGNPDNEIILVDNGSSDGSAEFVRSRFPSIKVLALPENLGFGGGSNAGFRLARHDIVVLLNNDMRVAPDFLEPLLEGFDAQDVFAVSCQIFFSDPGRIREETGLTQAWWQDGNLRVRHRQDDQIGTRFPCFYGGGGSCAFDRRKFLELGGFDSLLAPFYLEDTDLGFMAWKRGWRILYEPRSKVWHEHRGTIGKNFRNDQIQAVLRKNFILFCWKNIHEPLRLGSHFFFTYFGALASALFGDAQGRANLPGFLRATLQLPQALRSRWRARALAVVTDTEAFLRPKGGYYRDRFEPMEEDPGRLRVLFVSPYPIYPPIHGGGVFMYQTLRELSRLCEVHVIALLDYPGELEANQELRRFCASAEFLVRMQAATKTLGSLRPHAVREFCSEDLDWLIHRALYLKKIDILQLEYTVLGQYGGCYRRVGSVLFEHDIYFQSIARGLTHMLGLLDRVKAVLEYLRALRYELRMLPRFDQIQVCTEANGQYLASFLPGLAPRIRAGMRAGIDTGAYSFRVCGREPGTMLFLGSFRHEPNRVALEWFIRDILPGVVRAQPGARLIVVGSDPPPPWAYGELSSAIELKGFVEDIREPLSRYSVFVCPIRSGSGVRVKLLEAFASGIPVVSTTIGAEGLARRDGELCMLADEPETFAQKVVQLFENPAKAAELAARARAEVVAHWDMAVITRKLELSYREIIRAKRLGLR